ncbi:MAG: GNAT family N-acetyltransferase [Vicinamibacterales bacterium]
MTPRAFPFVDLDLAKRLEATEGHANAKFVESRARRTPETGACWIEVAGTYGLFDGAGSPCTQTFRLGMFEPVTETALDTLETFFASRGSDTFHEVSPLADPSALTVLTTRGYRPCELTSVLFQPLPVPEVDLASESPIVLGRIAPTEQAMWAETAGRGWGASAELREFMSSFGSISAGAEDTYPFLARLDGAPVATGSLVICNDVALLAGASTVPEARGRGAQRALLAARLRFASSMGCTIAMMCAAPGSSSQRNAERSGFRIAYTRIKWHKASAGT